MRRMLAAAIMVLISNSAYAGVGFGFTFSHRSSIGVGYYSRYWHPHHRPYYWWYPVYSVRYYEPYVEVRCEVKPDEATVLVDGYYAGKVDDFDGFFQRLKLSPGRHTLTFRHPGYAPYSLSVYGVRGQDIHIKQSLMAGVDRLPDDDRIQQERMSSGQGRMIGPDDEYRRQEEPQSQQPRAPQYEQREPQRSEPPREQPSASQRISGQGRVRMMISPDGASVYIDGGFWGVVRGQDAVELGLAAGPHTIEIVKPGYKGFRRDVNVNDGGEIVVEAVLEREQSGKVL